MKPVIAFIMAIIFTFTAVFIANALSVVPPAAPAKTYYVSASGNDNGDGSLSTPFKTIQKCLDVVNAGEACSVRAGTYNENLIIDKSGTSSDPITLARYENETVTINGGTDYTIKDSGSSSYWIIDGFTITTTGSSSTAILVTSSDWRGSTPTHWIIRNNTLLGGGVLIRGSYNLVENNIINGQHLAKDGNTWQNGIRDTWGGGEVTNNSSPTHHNVYRGNTIFGFSRSGIWSMGYTHDNIIEYNTIYDIYDTGNLDAGQCINLDGAGTVEWRHIVRGNDVSGCASVSIALENVFDTLIENNYVHDTTQGITSLNYGSVGCEVGGENNQYGDTDGDGHCTDANTNNIIRQNVVVNASEDAFVNYGMDGVHYLNNSAFGGRATMIFSRPQYLKYSDAIGNITITTLPAEFRTNSNNISPTGAYTNPPSNLSPTGAALDKITAVDTFQNSVTGSWLLDFAGNPRLDGALYDIGAYEFLSANPATATPVPLTPTSTPTVLPTDPYVSTIVNPASINVGEVATVNVNLNNVPAEGYTSAEFACTYDSTRVEVSNIVASNLFDIDPVTAVSGPQNGSFIVAIADGNGSRATTSGTVFTFSVTGLQERQTSIECTARVSRGDNTLVAILSLGAANLTVSNISAPVVTGQVLASKLVTIRLYNADSSIAASVIANVDGIFSLTAPAGAYTIIASADGFLGAQGFATLTIGSVGTMPVVALLAGDVDNNGVIDQFDAMTVGMSYNTIVPPAADLNNDGVINVLDLDLLADNYRKSGAIAWQ